MKLRKLSALAVSAVLLTIPAFADAEKAGADDIGAAVGAYLQMGLILALIFVVLLLLNRFRIGAKKTDDNNEANAEESEEKNAEEDKNE